MMYASLKTIVTQHLNPPNQPGSDLCGTCIEHSEKISGHPHQFYCSYKVNSIDAYLWSLHSLNW